MKYALKTQRNNNVFPSLFDDLITRNLFEGRHLDFADRADLPDVNIKEDERSFELELLVPGRSKVDFKIELKDDLLTIAAEAKDNSGEDEAYTHQEFHFKAFTRRFTLPKDAIDKAKIKASYEAGVLKLRMPKRPEEMEKEIVRSIKIS